MASYEELWAEYQKPEYVTVTKENIGGGHIKGFNFDVKKGGYLMVLYPKGTKFGTPVKPAPVCMIQVRDIYEANMLRKVTGVTRDESDMYSQHDLFSETSHFGGGLINFKTR